MCCQAHSAVAVGDRIEPWKLDCRQGSRTHGCTCERAAFRLDVEMRACHIDSGRAERIKRFSMDVPDHAAFRLEPFAVKTCRRAGEMHMGKEAVQFVNCLGDIAAEMSHIPKDVFVRWAMQLLSVAEQRGEC